MKKWRTQMIPLQCDPETNANERRRHTNHRRIIFVTLCNNLEHQKRDRNSLNIVNLQLRQILLILPFFLSHSSALSLSLSCSHTLLMLARFGHLGIFMWQSVCLFSSVWFLLHWNLCKWNMHTQLLAKCHHDTLKCWVTDVILKLICSDWEINFKHDIQSPKS